MKVTAIQTSGAYGATAAVGRGREGPVAEPKPTLEPDPKPVLSEQAEKSGSASSSKAREADIKRLVEAANEAIAHTGNRVHISHHKPTKRFVMKLIDGDSGDVVRQSPSEDFLKVSEQLADLRGMLFAAEG